MDGEIIYSPNKYRETEGIKDDGDICLTTDNEYFIKGSHKDHNIITYEKGLATPGKMTIPNITATVMKGFGTGVGGFSNTATIMYAMAAIFDKPGHEDQHETIMTRIKLLREIVGQEIDRIKGADKPSLPKEWKTFEKIEEDDTPEERTRKMRQNAMVVSKKPYFFRYLYPELNQKFKQFEASYNQICKDMFGVKLKKLLKKEEKTEDEKMLIRRYQKYNPLITSPCTMNTLCREFESIDFDIKFAKDNSDSKLPAVSMLPTFEDKYSEENVPEDHYLTVRRMYQEYTNKKQLKHLDALLQGNTFDLTLDDYKEIRSTIFDALIVDLQTRLSESEISGEEFLFICSRLAKSYSSFNWGFAWSILEDQILKYIPQGKSFYPVRDPEGEYEYLGETYSLKDISKITEDLKDSFSETMSQPIKIGEDENKEMLDQEPLEQTEIKEDSLPPFEERIPDDELFSKVLNRIKNKYNEDSSNDYSEFAEYLEEGEEN